MGVFFSLLSPLIMFVLFLLFLGNLNTEGIRQSFPVSTSAIAFFVNSWVFAGILAITPVTTSLASLQVLVTDQASGRFKDFAVSPIRRWKIIIGYFGSTLLVSASITTVVFVLGELYVVLNGGSWLTLQNALLTYGVLILLCIVFTSISSFAATFINSESAFTSLSVIIGTGIGFLAGVYVPVGSLPVSVVNVINTLPFSQSASLVREFFVKQSIDGLAVGNSISVIELNQSYGISIKTVGYTISSSEISILLVSISLIFTIAAVWRISQKLK
jgi:multidrug/hemolysin transport system permease protein